MALFLDGKSEKSFFGVRMNKEEIKDNLHYGWSWKDAVLNAEATGMKVYRSTDTLLLLDLDDSESLFKYESMFPLLEKQFELVELNRWHSKSGIGWHVILLCSPQNMLTRITLQAVLGSDIKREALALLMHRDGIENCSWLFKPKVEKEVCPF